MLSTSSFKELSTGKGGAGLNPGIRSPALISRLKDISFQDIVSHILKIKNGRPNNQN